MAFSTRQKRHGVPKMYWLSKRSWIFASSWLQIDPIRRDDRLQSQNPQRKWPTQVNFTYPNKFTYLNTSQIYHDRRCLDNRGCTVPVSCHLAMFFFVGFMLCIFKCYVINHNYSVCMTSNHPGSSIQHGTKMTFGQFIAVEALFTLSTVWKVCNCMGNPMVAMALECKSTVMAHCPERTPSSATIVHSVGKGVETPGNSKTKVYQRNTLSHKSARIAA